MAAIIFDIRTKKDDDTPGFFDSAHGAVATGKRESGKSRKGRRGCGGRK